MSWPSIPAGTRTRIAPGRLGGWYPLYRPPGYEQPHPAAWLAPLYEQFASRFLHADPRTRSFWQGVLRTLTWCLRRSLLIGHLQLCGRDGHDRSRPPYT